MITHKMITLEATTQKNEPYDEYVNKSEYQNIHFEEYRVLPIDKLQIRQEEK